jgi:hypothetical protein
MCCGLPPNKRWEFNRTWRPQLCFFSKQSYLSVILICAGQLHSVTGYCLLHTRPAVGTELICLLWGVGQIGMSTLKWASTKRVSDDEACLGFCIRSPWALRSSVLHQQLAWDTWLECGGIKIISSHSTKFSIMAIPVCLLFVFLTLQPIVVVFSTAR